MKSRKSPLKLLGVAAGAAVLSALNLLSAFGAPLAITDKPLFLSDTPPPLNMLVMSRDHRMYYEAYNDASDITGDGVLDTDYIAAADFFYYGYFDSERCYSYDDATGIFNVSGIATAKRCPGSWSGDWLNYVTTSRMDALRKVLYGGLRYIDTETDTVLQRAFIPQDAHSWGKEYTSVAVNGYDIREYTPLPLPTANRRHLIANTSPSRDGLVTGGDNPAARGVSAPKMRVLQSYNGRVWDWVSKERPVADSGFAGGIRDYIVRVRVCAANTFRLADEKNNCRAYSTGTAKPTGLLQDYGEKDSMLFGLLSGSYGKPHDGGVLRKPVGSLRNEINLATGQLNYALTPPGVIGTIDRLRVTGFNGDTYSCGWIATSSDAAGACSMWGNPTAEMMYEVARYYAGKSGPTSDFFSGAASGEETGIGLRIANWDANTDPYKTFPHCSKPFETVISDISPSYDSDRVPGSAFTSFSGDISMNASSIGQLIWNAEMGAGSRSVFIGDNSSVSDGAPTAKSVSSFGNIRGLSPEAPAKEGSYNAASVAHYALMNDLNTAAVGEQKMETFAVALASPLPTIPITVGGRKISMVPFAKSVGDYGIDPRGSYQPTNQIVDFYVDTLTETYGKFRVNFEDVEQGADHDMDAIAIYEYQVTGNQVTITVTSEYAAGSIKQHMGYVISGSTQDGVYLVVRDIPDGGGDGDEDYFLDTPAGQPPGGNWADGASLPYGAGSPVARTFTAGSNTAAITLKDPLYYAAKWGGFDDTAGPRATAGTGRPDNPAKWDSDGNGVPDNYFLVTSAVRLKDQLTEAFSRLLGDAGTSSAAAVSSGAIGTNTNLYQSYFDPPTWSGSLKSFRISAGGDTNNDGRVDSEDVEPGRAVGVDWDTSDPAKQMAPANRRIFTVASNIAAGTAGVYRNAIPFTESGIAGDAVRRAEINDGDGNVVGDERIAYLRGERRLEIPSGVYRTRSSYLGDIVNSAPIYVGAPSFNYSETFAPEPYSRFMANPDNRNRGKTVYVGANDGMLHAFDAETGLERFAFVPGTVFRNLARLTRPTYSHEYFVDGTPTVIDAYVKNAWRSVLVSGLNKGGQGIFALDVTVPETITEATASDAFLWEFTDAEDRDLGYTYSRPAIVKMHNGKWAAVFGNGYNNTETLGGADANVSATGNAVLYIVDLENGSLIRKIDTGVGMAQDPRGQSRPNGLATPAAADLDGDDIPDYVYAGDLFGNLWKFNLRDTNEANWDVAYRTGGVALPLFRAVNADGVAQPITERPAVRRGAADIGAVVLFGTGKFLEAEDRVLARLTTQSFYGIMDRDTNTDSDRVTSRTQLLQQTFTGPIGSGTFDNQEFQTRSTSQNRINLANHDGWYLDLVGPAGFEGEMQVTNPILRNGRVLFTTLIPDTDVCAYGGRSWLMEMNILDGSRPTPFRQYPAINSIGTDAIFSAPGMVSGETSDYLQLPDSSGRRSVFERDPGAGALGRQSWRQLR